MEFVGLGHIVTADEKAHLRDRYIVPQVRFLFSARKERYGKLADKVLYLQFKSKKSGGFFYEQLCEKVHPLCN